MNILITGGTGLIGRPLIKSLVENGHNVTVLSRKVRKLPTTPMVHVLEWDGRTVSGWGDQLNKTDTVINLAGENIGTFPWTKKRKKIFRESRINAGNVLVQAFQKVENRPQLFIQASAVGYYGLHGDERVGEATASGNDFSAQLCIDWENSTFPLEALGVRRIVIRTGVVLTTNGGVLPLMALPVRLFAGGPIAGGRQGIPWIHVDDEVNAVRFLLENQKSQGVYNLSAPNPVSNAEFTQTLAKVLNRPYWFHAPKFAIKLALGEMSTLLIDGRFMIPERLLKDGFEFKFGSIMPALQDLLGKN